MLRVTHDLPAQPVELDPSGRIVQDLPCLRCGYNLRSLHVDQICPKCGQLVRLCVHGDRLEYSDPEWINRVAAGTRWILWTLMCIPLLGLTVPFLSEGFAATALTLMLVAGFWQLTSPEPKDTENELLLSLRRLVRSGSIAGLLLACLLALGGFANMRIAPGVNCSPASVPCFTGWLLILDYLGRLARRLPGISLARNARILVRSTLIALAAWTVLSVLAITIQYMSPPLLISISGIMAPLLAIALFVTNGLLLLSIKILFDLRRQFKAAADSARFHAQQSL